MTGDDHVRRLSFVKPAEDLGSPSEISCLTLNNDVDFMKLAWLVEGYKCIALDISISVLV